MTTGNGKHWDGMADRLRRTLGFRPLSVDDAERELDDVGSDTLSQSSIDDIVSRVRATDRAVPRRSVTALLHSTVPAPIALAVALAFLVSSLYLVVFLDPPNWMTSVPGRVDSNRHQTAPYGLDEVIPTSTQMPHGYPQPTRR